MLYTPRDGFAITSDFSDWETTGAFRSQGIATFKQLVPKRDELALCSGPVFCKEEAPKMTGDYTLK